MIDFALPCVTFHEFFRSQQQKHQQQHHHQQQHKDGKLNIKGHKFVDIKYRMPTACDVCRKPLWDLFNPPPAAECLCNSLTNKIRKIVFCFVFLLQFD